MRSLLQHRLVQFILVGGAIFAAAPAAERRDVIAVRRQTIDTLAAADNSAKRQPLLTDRAKAIEERFIEDEILYREGLRLGFDKDDGIVRQRVIQKALFLAEELGGASRPPTDEELRAYFAAHQDRFALPPRIRFTHIFAKRQASLPPSPSRDHPGGGEVSPVGPTVDEDLPWIEQRLGSSFAEAVDALAPGEWSTPIRSAYGWHLVRVLSHLDARPAPFDDARSRVLEQFQVSRRQEAVATYLTRSLGKYRVDVDGRPVTSLAGSGRVAQRSVPSAED